MNKLCAHSVYMCLYSTRVDPGAGAMWCIISHACFHDAQRGSLATGREGSGKQNCEISFGWWAVGTIRNLMVSGLMINTKCGRLFRHVVDALEIHAAPAPQ